MVETLVGERTGMNMNIAMNTNTNANVTASQSYETALSLILMDHDMILLRPLLHDFTNEEVIWVDSDTAGSSKHPSNQRCVGPPQFPVPNRMALSQ
jgi:hypothetical protein